ncbi:FecR protein [Anatilimnocola aggregata]|uniref:FecR protein n=1 Tax=Anatilimnocola aggregata TaxID=2528021 RepID=A0A517Y4Y1_9BACT|nr:FecR domain-containing protein [Anatilimnocola aggregata]QDU25303.1 FecR protein [Anatilimnocola aggregata]
MTEQDKLRESFPRIAAGDATAADMERLEQAMERDPRSLRDFIEYMNLDSALEDWAAGAIDVRPLAITSGSRRISRRLAFAAVFAAAMLLGWVISRSSNPGIVEVSSASELAKPTQATLVAVEQCRWSEQKYYEGQRVPAGSLRLLAGNAIIRLDGGTLIVLRGDCDLQLRRDGGVNLRRGEIGVRSADDATGFVVHTPRATVVDQGTEFALRVDALGGTEVHVVEGSVRLEREGATEKRTEVVVTQQAVRIDQESALAKAIPYDGEPVAALLQRIRRQKTEKAVLVDESFDYPIGMHKPDLLNRGHGWRGPWQLPLQQDGTPSYPGTQRFMQITGNSDGNRVWETPAGKSFRARSLAEPINLAADGVLYIGLTIHAEKQTEAAGPFDKQGRSVRLSFRSDPSTMDAGMISFGTNNTKRPIIETSAGRSFVGRTKVSTATSMRLIGKVLTRTQGEDELSLIFLDEQENYEIEPPIWDVTTRGVQLAARLQVVFLSSHGPAARGLDDLRIGTTWWSVSQEGSSP